MTRDQFLATNKIENVIESAGIRVVGQGNQRKALCPFHADKNPSLAIDINKQTWFCHACQIGGSSIDFMARQQGVTVATFFKNNNIRKEDYSQSAPKAQPGEKLVEVTVYPYHDRFGNEVFQVVRYQPKTFRQRRVLNGKTTWDMNGVERVLYHLPEIQKSQTVWIVEGEKDADNLRKVGFVATCNCGGAGKWLDSYSECLIGKDVIICGDNDEPGKKHVELVFDSIGGKVKSAKLIKLPPPYKDVSDLIISKENAREELQQIVNNADSYVGGVRMPVYTMIEIEPRYREYVRSLSSSVLDLSKWLPSFKAVRPMVPGEVILVVADTGVGKTAILQNIARVAQPIPTIMFEMELPETLMYERFVSSITRMEGPQIEQAYRESDETLEYELKQRYPNLLICPESKLTLEKIERYINKSELKLGVKPKLALIDYAQLLGGNGDRRERISDSAEGLKVIAKETNTVIVVSSQITRPPAVKDDEAPVGVGLHSAKESGSLENSSGIVLGAWRDSKDKQLLYIKILKNTKGTAGMIIPCNYNGATCTITERAIL